jgi:hypothetical protein
MMHGTIVAQRNWQESPMVGAPYTCRNRPRRGLDTSRSETPGFLRSDPKDSPHGVGICVDRIYPAGACELEDE